MLKSIPPHRPTRRRAAWTAILGGLSLTLVACQEAVAPSSPASRAPNAAAARSSAPESARIPDQYIVTFVDGVNDAPGLAKQLVAQSNGTLGFTYETAVKGFSAHLSPEAASALEHNPNIASVEPDQTVAAAGTQSPAPWWLDRLDQRTAALDNSFSWGNSGAGVTIYILDSGIHISHQDFEGRANYGYDFVSGTSTADDCNGHGTHTAGLAGGKVYGTAKGATLTSVRVLDCSGNGASSTVIAGLDWVARNHSGPSVANLSLSGAYSSTVNQAVANTIAAGVTVVVAAGDNGSDACNYSPASASGAITVGAMITDTGVDAMMSFSNYGSCVDMFAPGYQIVSDWYTSTSAVWLLTGTSPSSPMAAGAAAGYLAANPSATASQVASALNSVATTGVLAGLGTGSPNRLLYVGGGSAPPPPPPDTTTPPPPPPPPPPANAAPVASFTSSCSKASCSFNASGSTDDVGIVSYAWTFGDGATASGSTPTTTHVYTSKGTYSMTVTLTVTDGGGLTGQASKKLTIKNSGK
jgi:subtilisin family serine protease